MDVRVRCCGLGPNVRAADGSHIGETVVKNYLESEDYKLSIDGKLTTGFLTHRGRALDGINPNVGNPAVLKRSTGRDDSGLIVGENMPTFTHYVREFYIENVPGEGPWLCALVHILDEKLGFDKYSVENIKRLKALIRSGIKLTCSLVVLAYWNSSSKGTDECQKIKSIKSLDWTMNPSFGPLARITEVYDDDEELEKEFSEIEKDKTLPTKEGEIKVKEFSDLNSIGCGDMPKTSKINGNYTFFKVKQFSAVSSIDIIDENMIEEPIVAEVQKEYSVASLKERARYAKLSPRMRFRRLFLEYKQLVKTMGGPGKIDPETERVLKSMFATDCLDIIKTISPEVMTGKQINTLIGASSLGKNVRVAAQKLQMPFRFAMQEANRQGFVSKNRYEKIQSAYSEFIQAMTDEVFGGNPIPEGLEKEIMEEEEEK